MVVGTLGVVVVVVEGDVWLLGSTIWLGHPRRKEKGKKRKQSKREYSSKVLTSKDLHYLCICINKRGSICGLTVECQNKRGRS